MSVLVYVLTVFALAVVVLTRKRLSGDAGGGRVRISDTLLRAHTVVGAGALVFWLFFLILGGVVGETAAGLIGIVALAFWWSLALIALGLLARWLPSGGKHAGPEQNDAWDKGPALSLVAHVGTVVAVAVFTYAYLNNSV